MSQLFREAVGDAQEQYDTLLMHLSLIRDLTHLGQNAPVVRGRSRRSSPSAS